MDNSKNDDMNEIFDGIRTLLSNPNERAKSHENAEWDDIDNMTIKELRLKAFDDSERLFTNRQKASIASVIVYVIFT